MAAQIDAEIASWRKPWTGKGKDEYNHRVFALCGKTSGGLLNTIRSMKSELSASDYDTLRQEIEDNFFKLADSRLL
jgi:hypothetical protein